MHASFIHSSAQFKDMKEFVLGNVALFNNMNTDLFVITTVAAVITASKHKCRIKACYQTSNLCYQLGILNIIFL